MLPTKEIEPAITPELWTHAWETLQKPKYVFVSRIDDVPGALLIATSVHNDALGFDNRSGASLGGTRIAGAKELGIAHLTADEQEAVAGEYAGNLASAMTMKYLVADLVMKTLADRGIATAAEQTMMRRGGGKTIILMESIDAYNRLTPDDRRRLYSRHALHMRDRVNANGILHVTAVDMGSKPADMSVIAHTVGKEHVACQLVEDGGTGDPSPTTAVGVWSATKALLSASGEQPADHTYAIQGVGAVGAPLIGEILSDIPDAAIAIADTADERVDTVLAEHPGAFITPVAPEKIYGAGTVFMPCAGPQILTTETLGVFINHRVRFICGSANDQFPLRNFQPDADVVAAYHHAGMRWVPDPLASMGGITDVEAGLLLGPGNAAHERARTLVARGVFDVAYRLVREADRRGISVHEAFDQLVLESYIRHCLTHNLTV